MINGPVNFYERQSQHMAATAQPSASCEAYNVVNSAAPFIISCSAKKKKKNTGSNLYRKLQQMWNSVKEEMCPTYILQYVCSGTQSMNLVLRHCVLHLFLLLQCCSFNADAYCWQFQGLMFHGILTHACNVIRMRRKQVWPQDLFYKSYYLDQPLLVCWHWW